MMMTLYLSLLHIVDFSFEYTLFLFLWLSPQSQVNGMTILDMQALMLWNFSLLYAYLHSENPLLSVVHHISVACNRSVVFDCLGLASE
jgi:hypothetical protein